MPYAHHPNADWRPPDRVVGAMHAAEQGRGLRVTRDVARGELLFVSNADAVHESTTQSVRLGMPLRGAAHWARTPWPVFSGNALILQQKLIETGSEPHSASVRGWHHAACAPVQ
jgi:hypothetical protein